MGYKGNDVYVFFTENDISIYRVEKNYDSTEFAELVSKLIEDRNIKSFVNNLTDVWPDYDLYEYDSNFINLKYSLKGIEIQFNVSKNNGVIVYNNYNGQITKNINVKTLVNGEEDIPNNIYLELNVNLLEQTEMYRLLKCEIESGE